MPNLRGELPFDLTISDRHVPVHSAYWWSGGGVVLTISTTIPRDDLAFEQISTYIGHPDTGTVVTHLIRAGGHRAAIESDIQPYEQINTLQGTRSCAYEHLQFLQDWLTGHGHHARLDLGEDTFRALELAE